ncbi:MAG: AAA family ATPase [bacterium]
MKSFAHQELVGHYSDTIKCWILRALYELKGYSLMSTRYGVDEYERILSLLDLKELFEKYEDEALPKKVLRKALKPLYEKYEGVVQHRENILSKNIDALGELIDLNQTEKALLSFGVLLHSVRELEDATDILGDIATPLVPQVLAVILGEERTAVRQALEKEGLLNRTGLFRLNNNARRNQLLYQIDMMSDISDVLLNTDQPDIMKALSPFFTPAKKSTLTRDDYSYIKEDYELITHYLKRVSQHKEVGVNILIFGAPGTGKTEMARTLATEINSELYEVSLQNNNDDDEENRGRFDSYLLCQHVLKRKPNTLILFDEIEDAFIRDGSLERFGIRTSTDAKKGQRNHILEVNDIPTIWVSNVISHIDEAIIRRFDFVLEVKTPPKSIRIRMLKRYTAGLPVSEKWIESVATNDKLAPALIARAVKVAKTLNHSEQTVVEQQIERVLSNTLNAMGYNKNLSARSHQAISYRLDVLNPDYDLTELQAGLQDVDRGCFCLYGPSGTGKSEFVHQLADTLDKVLLIKRASDVLDPYVGMTERNIKAMFEQAEDESAILLLDEADSFLRDRNLSRESWEVTQVNELLTQMEQFRGLFFCTTNLMENLDQASIRRFDLKVKFDYLKPTQNWLLFQQVLQDCGSEMSHEEEKLDWEKKVLALQGVTPGDFATVSRQNRFSKQTLDAEQLFKGLEREIRFKQYGAFKGIGFIQS